MDITPTFYTYKFVKGMMAVLCWSGSTPKGGSIRKMHELDQQAVGSSESRELIIEDVEVCIYIYIYMYIYIHIYIYVYINIDI
jgi:hypothetical protein